MSEERTNKQRVDDAIRALDGHCFNTARLSGVIVETDRQAMRDALSAAADPREPSGAVYDEMSKRERVAIELLRRIYERDADYQLSDESMLVEWIDDLVMEFIREHGAFADQLRGAR